MYFLREVTFICSLHNHQYHTVNKHASLTFLKNRNKTSELQTTVTEQTQQDSKWRAFTWIYQVMTGAEYFKTHHQIKVKLPYVHTV